MKELFRRLNPEAVEYGAFDEIDFPHALGGKEKFGENIEAMVEEYPQYQWTEGPKKDDPYEKYLIKDVSKQAKEYGYDVIKESRLRKLEWIERELDKTLKLLSEKENQLTQLLSRSISVKQKAIKPIKEPTPKAIKMPFEQIFKTPKTRKSPPRKKIKKTPQKKTKVKPKIYEGKRGGKYYLKQIPNTRKKRRIYV